MKSFPATFDFEKYKEASKAQFPVFILTCALAFTALVVLWMWGQVERPEPKIGVVIALSTVLWAIVIYSLLKARKNLLSGSLQREGAEMALLGSEAYFREMFENASDLVYTIDIEGNFKSLNKRGEQLTGYAAEEICRLNFVDVVAPEYLEKVGQHLCSISKGKDQTALRLEIVRKDGERVSLEVSNRLIRENGVPIGVQGFARDIGERLRLEESLRASEEQYRAFIERSSEGIWRFDLTHPISCSLSVEEQVELTLSYGYLAECNDAMAQMYGLNRAEDLRGKRLQDLFVLSDATNYEFLSAFIAGNYRLTDAESHEIDADGNDKYFLNNLVGLVKDGNLIGAWGTQRDITPRRRAAELLRASEERLRTVINSAPVILYAANAEGIVTMSEGSGLQSLGLKPGQMVGTSILEDYASLELVESTGMKTPFAQVVARVLSGEAISGFTQTNGIYYESRFTPQWDEYGKIVGLTALSIDVTDRRRATEALRESEYKLRGLLESMNEGLVQLDERQIIQFVNDRFCEMTGYCHEELVGKTNFDIFLDEEGRQMVAAANEERLKGLSGHYEVRLKKKNGELLWMIVGGTPIINADGAVVGTMGVFTDITERKRAELRLIHGAFYDNLTGLANRTLFIEHLQMAIARGNRDKESLYSVLFLDFDRFKVINDSLGHAEGDRLLQQVARRLENSVRSCDLVARLGGDEFTILLTDLADASDATLVAERIQEDLKAPFDLGGGEVFMSASIGITLSSIEHHTAEEMLRDADIAMYRAKAQGKAQYQVFDREMHAHAMSQLKLETELRRALKREEFYLEYQPIINLETEAIVGFEALIRWQHPKRGIVSPGEFIAAAEENGLILPIGWWILSEACRRMREWQTENPLVEQLSVSVNLSSKQFLQFDLADRVAETLSSTGLDPRCLKLEITESHVMENSDMAVTMMNRLRALGVELSLDDFGTGYSSLSYLHRLPVSTLKIDRTFVTRMTESLENGEIVYTVIKLAQNLKMQVIAEGVESREQFERLREIGCENAQGYFFSKPLNAEAARLFIKEKLKPAVLLADMLGDGMNSGHVIRNQ